MPAYVPERCLQGAAPVLFCFLTTNQSHHLFFPPQEAAAGGAAEKH